MSQAQARKTAGRSIAVGRCDGPNLRRAVEWNRARFRIPLAGRLLASACFLVAAVRLS
jgi:hypothetical protein